MDPSKLEKIDKKNVKDGDVFCKLLYGILWIASDGMLVKANDNDHMPIEEADDDMVKVGHIFGVKPIYFD